MKTATLTKCPLCRTTSVSDLTKHLLEAHSTSEHAIKQIQFDAMKEGMRWAAKIVLLSPTTYQHKDCGNDNEMHSHLAGEVDMINKSKTAILTEAEQLTEKDLP